MNTLQTPRTLNTVHIALATLVAAFLCLGVGVGAATAQQVTSNGVTVTTTPVTMSVSAGTAVNLGTITFVGPSEGRTIVSLPVTITAGGGAAMSNISNCAVHNASTGAIVAGPIASLGTGSNWTETFAFSPQVNATNVSQAYVVRCNVASGTVSGASFVIAGGSPNVQSGTGTGTATTSATLSAHLTTAPSVPANSQNVALASILFTAATSSVNVSAIPVTVTAASGASTAHLSQCRIVHAATAVALSGTYALTSGSATNFVLTTPLQVSANPNMTLALRCNVMGAPVGSTFHIATTPANITATNASTGQAVTPSAGASTSGTVIVSSAVTTPPPTTTPGTPTTPGIPDTGTGSNLAAILALAIAGSVLLMGSAYVTYRTRIL